MIQLLFIVLTIVGFAFSIAKAKPRVIGSELLGLDGFLILLLLFLAGSTITLLYKEIFMPTFFPVSIPNIFIHLFLLISFTRKKTYYPWCQITASSFDLINIEPSQTITLSALNYIETNIHRGVFLIKILPSALIIVYLLKSKRAKNTFIN